MSESPAQFVLKTFRFYPALQVGPQLTTTLLLPEGSPRSCPTNNTAHILSTIILYESLCQVLFSLTQSPRDPHVTLGKERRGGVIVSSTPKKTKIKRQR